ncbi:MAG: sensor histidine kinase [Oscillospiraceae bacterium]|nr:sensor histidine kinase [Oscillospiraceae bacterium]
MKSLYGRQFALVAGLILFSFLLLGSSFAFVSYQYTLKEMQDTLERNTQSIAELAEGLAANQGSANPTLDLASIINSEYFNSKVLPAISHISNADIIMCYSDGEISYDISKDGFSHYSGKDISDDILSQTLQNHSFKGFSNLGGLFNQNLYVVGLPLTLEYSTMNANGTITQSITFGFVYASADLSSITELWRSIATMFFIIAGIVITVAFILTSVTTARQIRPLKEMAEAVKRFGHGEFEVRVNPGRRMDEIGELAEAFNTMADSLAKSEAKRSEFIANVSHELKTPMTTIAGFADGILDGTIPPSQQSTYLQTISSETRRLSRLVRNMLDLSRLQSTESLIAQERFNICEVLARVLVSLEPKINARRLDVDANIPEDAVMVWGDPDAITQVCYNLLDNAIKFSEEGSCLGVSITLKGGKTHTSIRNHGVTIPPDELPLVFDRFHKTDHSRSIDRDGVGLGLYIVKTILNNHKETIVATSADGNTEFTFTLTQA